MAEPLRTWIEDALCKGVPQEVFFPPPEKTGGRGGDGLLYLEARMWCEACPVREECLEFALETRATHGMWGGMSPRQRRRIWRKGNA